MKGQEMKGKGNAAHNILMELVASRVGDMMPMSVGDGPDSKRRSQMGKAILAALTKGAAPKTKKVKGASPIPGFMGEG